MADNDIEIKVVVDGNGAITVLDKVGNEIKKVESASEGGTRGFGLLERSVITLNQGLQLAQTAFSTLSGVARGAIDAIARGSEVSDLTEAFGDLSERAGVVSDVFLNQLNAATARTISNFDLMKKSNELLQAGLKPDAIIELSKAARVFSEKDGSDMIQTIDALSNSLLRGDDRFLKSKGIIVDNQKAFKEFAAEIGKTTKQLSELDKAEAIRQAVLKETAKVAAESSKIQVDAGDNINQINKTVTDTFDDLKRKLADSDGVNAALTALSNILSDVLPKAADAAVNAINKLSGQFAGFDSKIDLAWKTLKNWASNLVSTGGALKSLNFAAEQSFLTMLKERAQTALTGAATDLLTGAVDRNTEAKGKNAKATGGASGANEELTEMSKEAAKALEDLRIQLESLNQDYLEFGAQEIDGTILDSLFGKDPEKQIEDFGKSVNDAIANAIQGIAQAISSGGFDRGSAGNIGGIFGALLGKSEDAKDLVSEIFGDSELIAPGLQLVGSLLGETLGKGIFSGVARIFGAGRDEQTEARKNADKFFADLFDANRLSIVIDGQLKQIKDLVFGNDTDIFETGSFDDLFQSLPDAARGAFAGVGIAFEELIGGLGEQSGQLAAILANNVGGSLNNLQLLIRQTGKSVEELEGAIVKSFENGTISVLEAQSALLGIQQATQVGIPDGLGLTVEALENMFAAGSKGGIAVLDALQDIGHEAKELGIKDLPALQKNLADSGRFSAEQIEKVFEALQANGIESVEELTSATKNELIAVLAQLQAQGVLEEAAESAIDLVETLDRLPDRKDIEVNLKIKTTGDVAALNNAATINGTTGGDGLGLRPGS